MTIRGGGAFTVARALLYATAFIGLWAWIGAWVRRFDSRVPLPLPASLRPIGVLVAVAGVLVVAACVATFVTVGRGTPAPFDPPREFVASGPYRYVRNPMYLGAGAVILGSGLALSSGALVALAAVFLLLLHLFVVFHEEPALDRRFGAGYRRYRESVHRWLVRIPERRPREDERGRLPDPGREND